MTAKVRAASSKRVERPIQHARERPHCGEAATRRGSSAPPVLLSARSTNSGPSRPSTRAREKRGRDRRRHPRSTGRSARPGRRRGPARSPRCDPRARRRIRRQAAARASPQARRRDRRRKQRRRRRTAPANPASAIARMVTSAGPTKVAAARLPLAAEQPRKAPGVFKAEPAIDGAPVGRGIEHGHASLAREFVHRPAHQLGRQTAATVIARHQHHADPGETLAIGQRRGGGDDAAFSGAGGVHAAELEEDAPIGGNLVPAALRPRARRRRPAPTASATA